MGPTANPKGIRLATVSAAGVLPGLGARWIGHCDAPDRELFPQRYAGLQSADVYAALEVGTFHLGLWGLSWLVRAALVRNSGTVWRDHCWQRSTRPRFLGSDRGGMLVTLEGIGQQRRNPSGSIGIWSPEAGTGRNIPATPSVVLAKRLLDGTLQKRGAMPCVGLFTLDDFLGEIADLDIAAGAA